MKTTLSLSMLLLLTPTSPTLAQTQPNTSFTGTGGGIYAGAFNWRGMATGFRGGALYEPVTLQRSTASASQTRLGFYAEALGVEGSHLFDPRASTQLISSIFGVGGGFHLTHSVGRLSASVGLGHYSLRHSLSHNDSQNSLTVSRRSGWGMRYAISAPLGKDRPDRLQLSVTQLPSLKDERRGTGLIIGLDFLFKPR